MARRETAIQMVATTVAAVGVLGLAAAQAGAPRFFASTAQCEHAGALTAAGCRTAFANARAEFTSKAPRFSSRRACYQAFGPCMPWPPGTHRYGDFRPQWIGIDLDDAAGATPAVAPGRRHLDFTPQSTASLSPAAASPPAGNRDGVEAPAARIMTPRDDAEAEGGPAPRAGGGFTVIDGVLTYPAPARFQPKNPKQP